MLSSAEFRLSRYDADVNAFALWSDTLRAQPPEERADRERQIQAKNDVVCLYIARYSCEYTNTYDARLLLFSHAPVIRFISHFAGRPIRP